MSVPKIRMGTHTFRSSRDGLNGGRGGSAPQACHDDFAGAKLVALLSANTFGVYGRRFIFNLFRSHTRKSASTSHKTSVLAIESKVKE